MKTIRKILKGLLLISISLLFAFLLLRILLGTPMPVGVAGPQAEQLADRMLRSLNYEGYQNLEEINWSFPRGHHFVWRKQQDTVEVRWDDYQVIFCPSTLQGRAFQSGVPLKGGYGREVIAEAWELFANDSFWLVAPFKIRDPGTVRELVTTDIGQGLLVTYTSGGVTPGDSYLWVLDANDRPVAWQMWVDIIPIGGLEFSWEGWEQQGGVWFAPLHQGPGPIAIDLKNLSVK